MLQNLYHFYLLDSAQTTLVSSQCLFHAFWLNTLFTNEVLINLDSKLFSWEF